MNAKQTILHWLESGDLGRAAAGLKSLAERHGDKSFSLDTGLQSGRLQNPMSDRARGVVGQPDFLLEQGRIRFALQEMAAGLDENWPSDGVEGIAASSVFLTKKKPGTEKLALWLGIAAAVVAIAGYSLRDVFEKKEPPTTTVPAEKNVSEPAVQPVKAAEKPIGQPNISPEKTAKPPKNQTNITIKDKGKAGTIIKGDSNKIELKQDF